MDAKRTLGTPHPELNRRVPSRAVGSHRVRCLLEQTTNDFSIFLYKDDAQVWSGDRLRGFARQTAFPQYCEWTEMGPGTKVALYKEEDGSYPFIEWFDSLPAKVQDKCYLRLERLRELGHELRRPEADFLRDGIYELRASLGGVHHRILYFFHGEVAAVVFHGLAKDRVVPPKEIDPPSSARSPLGRIQRSTLMRRHKMAKTLKTTHDAVEIVHRRVYEGNQLG